MNIQENRTCLICQSKSLSQIDTVNEEALLKCNSCSFVFFKRIPTEQELTEHYAGYGTGFLCSDITVKRYNELLDKMEPFRKTNRLLDVGCGAGFFLEQARKRGWEVFGVEFSDLSVSRCREKGIQMEKGVLDISNYELESFDVLTSFEVVEHINNPIEEFSKFNALLRKGGLLYVTTPNYKYIFKNKPRFKQLIITYPEHLSYYTPKTIRILGKLSGFKTEKILTTGIVLSDIRSKNQNKVLQDKKMVEQVEGLRERSESNTLLQLAKNFTNKFLTIFGIGDSLKAWFIKI
jgi:2-polyprenyl-3-methyl-5-hydroxy-6-metoxy-1,4-benzoquinol methylase